MIGMHTLFYAPEKPLFSDLQYFEFSYSPEHITCRDTQIREIYAFIHPGRKKNRPLVAVIRGLPGTGKTMCINRALRQAGARSHTIVPVYFNGHESLTSFEMYEDIYYTLSRPASSYQKFSHDILPSRIRLLLQEKNAFLVIHLADAHRYLLDGVLNSVLQSLLRLNDTFPVPRVRILLSAGMPPDNLMNNLDPAIRSTFNDKEIYFPVYSREEVSHILRERVTMGLNPGVMPEESFELIVNTTVLKNDLRTGIELVRSSVIQAEMNAREMVDTSDVMKATGDYYHL